MRKSRRWWNKREHVHTFRALGSCAPAVPRLTRDNTSLHSPDSLVYEILNQTTLIFSFVSKHVAANRLPATELHQPDFEKC